MSKKRENNFDRWECFLTENQNDFLKNMKKISDNDKASDDFYNTLGQQSDELFQNHDEGQLAIDVYQKSNNIVVIAAIAGIDPEKLDISLHNDILTIRGERALTEKVDEEDYFYKECYWGKFSRSIILPVEVNSEKIQAGVKAGILKITLPIANPSKKIKVKIIDEE